MLLCVVASFGLKYGARFYRIGTMSWTKRNFLTRSNLRDVVLLLSFMSTVFFGITTGEVIVGFLLLALGCFVHFLSKGVLVRNTVLTRRGIYNIVRHPYYLSNFVVDYGFCALSGNLYLLLIYPFLFFWSYQPTMREEEAYLQSIHGDAFIRYRSDVPRIFPDRTSLEGWRTLFEDFSWKRITWKERGRILRFWSMGLFIMLLHEFATKGLSVLTDLLHPAWHDIDTSLLVPLTIIVFMASAVVTWIANKRKSRTNSSQGC